MTTDKVKPTPGPWELIEFGGLQIGNPETGEAVCTMWGSRTDPTDPRDANAHLISAAPDLLAAGKSLLPTNLDLSNPNLADSAIVPLDVSLGELRALAAAIAKATGAEA